MPRRRRCSPSWGRSRSLYLTAVARAKRCDRRGRQWPKHRTFFFLAGLAAAGIDLCSGVGTEADTRLSAHMLEHMILWVIVAPLLAAGAPVRLAFRSLPRAGRRQLARCMHSRTVSALTSPVGSVSLFCAVILVTYLFPAAVAALRLLGAETAPAAKPRIDIPGTITASVGLFGLVYGFSNAETHGWGAPLTIVALAAGVALLAAFIAIERRVEHPLLPLRVIADRGRGGAYLAVAIVGAECSACSCSSPTTCSRP